MSYPSLMLSHLQYIICLDMLFIRGARLGSFFQFAKNTFIPRQASFLEMLQQDSVLASHKVADILGCLD